MTLRALVIGSQTGELAGVHNDVATMTALLEGRGFTVDSRIDKEATQQRIRDAYERLITDTRDGDPTVVYFSGHGGRAQVNTPHLNPLPDLQFIVPSDYDESTPGDFRGITSQELSVLLARLTGKTRNATVILDCCHAAHMVRDVELRVKALPYPTYLDIGEHLGIQRALGLRLDLPHVEQNPYAVRLVACAPWEQAYEYVTGGRSAGILTDMLRRTLEQAGSARVPWNLLIQRIRARVSTLALGQRPEVAGPSRRWIFDTDEAHGGTAFAVLHSPPNRLTLPGAGLLAIAPGDTFGITAAGETAATDSTIIATATVTKTDGITVHGTYELRAGRTELPPDVEAHPLVTSAPRHPVRVRGGGALAADVSAAIDAVPGLRAVGTDRAGTDQAGTDGDPLLAEVEVGDSIALWDGGPAPTMSVPAGPAGIERIADELRRLARTAGLRRLAPATGEALPDTFTVEWGRVIDGDAGPLPGSGTLLHVGDPVYLRLRNDGARNLFFHVFDLGVTGAVTLITAADPSGLRLAPKQGYTIGERDRGGLEGSPLVWPDTLPATGPRRESLLVIVTTERQDLSVLGHAGVGATLDGSALSRAVAEAAGPMTTREWRVPEQRAAKFSVVRFDFTLSPTPRTV